MTNIGTDWSKWLSGVTKTNGNTTNPINKNATESTSNIFGGRGAGESVDVDAAEDEFAAAQEALATEETQAASQTQATNNTQSTQNTTSEDVEDLKDE